MERILIISDGKPGHLNQSIAFCKIKNIEYDILTVEFKSKLFKSFSYLFDKFGFYTNFLFKPYENKDFNSYSAIISTGSSTYYLNKYLSKKFNKKSIVLMLPKSYKYEDFTYILAQEHDNPPKLNNIIKIPLNLSFSSPKNLIKKEFDKKAIGIIVGGNNDIFTLKSEDLKKVLDKIFSEFKNYSKYITTSRRTPKQVETLIESYDFDYKLIYSKEPTINPIPDFLTLCNELFITIDSTSMLSEARANSDAKINIIQLESKKDNTKYHRLASKVESLNKKVDFEKILKKIEI